MGEDWVQDLRQGDDVGAVITELDLEKNRISFSMKQSRQQQASDQLHAAREAALLEDSDDGSDVLATIMDQQSGDVDSDDFDDGDVSMASSEGAQQPTASETTDKNKVSSLLDAERCYPLNRCI